MADSRRKDSDRTGSDRPLSDRPIQLLEQAAQIARAVQARRKSAASHGIDADDRTGLVFRDEYVTIHRDAVRFPSGRYGTHLRLAETAAVDGISGAVALPSDGERVYLARVYRYPVQAWEWELPRGYMEPGLTAEQVALKELREELGLRAERCVDLGVIRSNSGLFSTAARAFFVVAAAGQGEAAPEATEVLGERRAVTVEQLASMIGGGEITDGFTLAAVALATAKGLLGPRR